MSSTDPTRTATRQTVPMSPEVRAELDRRPRSADEIERDLIIRTDRLSATIDELVGRLRPATVGAAAWGGLRARLVTPSGKPRPEVVGAAVGALIGVGVIIWRARR